MTNYTTDYNTTVGPFPKSCCEKETNPCFYPFETGCAEAFVDTVLKYIKIIGYAAIAFGVAEVNKKIRKL